MVCPSWRLFLQFRQRSFLELMLPFLLNYNDVQSYNKDILMIVLLVDLVVLSVVNGSRNDYTPDLQTSK